MSRDTSQWIADAAMALAQSHAAALTDGNADDPTLDGKVLAVQAVTPSALSSRAMAGGSSSSKSKGAVAATPKTDSGATTSDLMKFFMKPK